MKKYLMSLAILLIAITLIACNNTFTVSFNTSDGSIITSQEIKKNKFAVRPEEDPKLAEHDFIDWYIDDKYSEVFEFDKTPITSNITIYAKFEKTEVLKLYYDITFETFEGSNIPTQEVREGDLIIKPSDPVLAKNEFKGWFKDSNYTETWDFLNDKVLKAITLYAKFEPITTNFNETLKILSIGNSFSEDAHQHIWQIANSYGIKEENIIIANMFIGGAELIRHVENIEKNTAGYQYQKFMSPTMQRIDNHPLSAVIQDEDWDIITFQQASHHSGVETSFLDFNTLTNFVDVLANWALENATNPNVEIGWHMTWAYEQTSNHSGFNNYDNDQLTMYEKIVETTINQALSRENISFVVPSGTAIQNARTSYLGDTFTRDGFHLSMPLGRYIAGLMFFKQITGFEVSTDTIKYIPEGISTEEQALAIESVNNAYLKPFEITESKYKEDPRTPITHIDTLPLSFTPGYWHGGSEIVPPEESGLFASFAASNILSREFIEKYNKIEISEGYQIRIIRLNYDGFGKYTQINRSATNFTNTLNIDNTFLEDAPYFAFNISRIDRKPAKDYLDIYPDVLHFSSEVVHTDEILNFKNGKWTLENNLIDNELSLASNVVSNNYLPLGSKTNVEIGYNLEIVYLSFDTNNGYQVLNVSELLNGEITLTEEFDYIAFNFSKTNNEAINESEKRFNFTFTRNNGHIDDPNLSFEPGFWNGGTSIQPAAESGTFAKFAASNILSREYIEQFNEMMINPDYEIRIIRLNYDGTETYTQINRSNNLSGTIIIDNSFLENAPYFAFNISKKTGEPAIELLDIFKDQITFN